MNQYERLGRLVDRMVRRDLMVTICPRMVEVED